MAFKDILGSVTKGAEKGAETINRVAAGDLGVVTQSEAWISFMWWAKLIIWFLVLVVGGVMIWHYWFKFNKRVLVKKLKGKAVIDIYLDRGKIVTDQRQKTKLILLRTKKTCPVPSYKYTTKMGKQDFYELYLDEKGNLHPINDQQIIDQVTSKVTSDKNIDFHILASWRLEEMKLAEEKFRKQSFLKEHMPEIMFFMAMVLGTAILWVTSKSAEASGIAQASAIKDLANALVGLR